MTSNNQYSQNNNARGRSQIYANQGGNQIIHNHHGRGRFAGRTLLVTLAVDVVFFFYGMTAYTGRNSTGDLWRSGIFLGLLVVTGTMFRRWLRR